jgi:two-component system, LytTR family, sensor kinase
MEAPRRRGWALALLGATAMAIVFAVVLRAQAGVPFLIALISGAVDYYLLGGLMVGVWRISERLARRRQRGAALLASHLLLGIAVLVVWRGLYAGFLRLSIGPDFWRQVYADSWGFQLLASVTTYGMALGVVLALQAARREREQERRAAAAELLAREAELQAVKGQLQPHFLMNALNSIVALLDEEPEQARAVLFRLADVLHAVFDRLDEKLVPLETEIAFIASYLEIEQVRLGERLRYRMAVAGGLESALVPPFLLQPLVENAIKHGIAPFARGGSVEVAAERVNGHLRLEVSDTGPGCQPGREPAAATVRGHGLELTARRLRALFGEQGRLDFVPGGGRFTVRLDLPLADDVH